MLVLLLLLACSTTTPAPPTASKSANSRTNRPSTPEAVIPREGRRIVAIGDLHGDRAGTEAVLAMAGLRDEKGSWTGGTTILVQTGDTTDRGPDSKGVIDVLRDLVPKAKRAGGRVVMLNGNHEVMNLQGDWRYVSPEDVETFGGIDRRKKAFSGKGKYGKFLSTLPLVAKVGSTIFVHGGVTEANAELGVEGINRLARNHLFDEPGPLGHPIHGDSGPTWYRGYVRDPEPSICPSLARALKSLDATRMVVGHTTQRDGVLRTRCDGALAVIDVGIGAYYGSHHQVWELVEDDARVITPTGTTDLQDPKAAPSKTVEPQVP